VSRRRRRAALVGNGALVGVRGRLGVGRHKQGPGKLSRGSEGNGHSVVAAHGDPWFTGKGDRAVEAIGARDAYGKGTRSVIGASTSCLRC
jgi:hypothetical protein